MGFLQRCIRFPRAYFRNNVTQPACKWKSRGYVIFTQKSCTTNCVQQFEISNTPVHFNSYLSSGTVEDDIVLLINSMKRGRISRHNLYKIITHFEENDVKLNEDTSILLLNCCGSLLPSTTLEERQELTNRVWEVIKCKSNGLTLKCYHALLEAYAENLHKINPNEFIKSMKVTPDNNTYYHLLRVIAKQGNIELATEILNHLKEQEIPLNEDILNLLVETQSVKGNVADALEIIKSMETNGLKPSHETYTLLACAYARKGDLSNVLEIIQNNDFDAKSFMSIVKALSESGNGKHIPDVVEFLIFPLNDNEPAIINTIIELTYTHRCNDAYEIINNTPALEGNNILIQCANCLLAHMVIVDRPFSEILNIVKNLIESKKYPDALLKVAEISVYERKVKLAPLIFEEMKKQNLPVRPHYYWPLFIAGYQESGEKQVHSLIEHMISIEVRFDHDTICDYILPYINNVDALDTFKKLRNYANCMSMPSFEVLTAMLSFLLRQGRLEECILLKERIKGNIIHDNIVNSLTDAYTITKDIRQCLSFCFNDENKPTNILEEFLLKIFNYKNVMTVNDVKLIFEELQRRNIVISLNTSSIIKHRIYKMNFTVQDTDTVISCLDALTTRNISTSNITSELLPTTRKYIPHPNDMTTNELACHLLELKHKGLNTKGVLRKLFIAYCKENNLAGAENIKKEIESNNFEWTAGMKASLFDLYVKREMLPEASNTLNELQSNYKSFKIDNFKIIRYATALVKNNQINEAFSIIETHNFDRTNNRLMQNCWELLNAMSNSKHFDKTKDMLNLLIAKEVCVVNNKLLGPLVKGPLQQGDIISAVNIFLRCAQMYRALPQKQEIVNTLTKMYTTYHAELKQVLNVIKDIHGEQESILSFILALAESEYKELLKNILNESAILGRYIINGLQYYPIDKKSSILLTILETNINLPENELLYEELLSTYNKLGDHQNAIALWKRMNGSVKPTAQFLTIFVNLLVRNKVPIPKEIELNESEIHDVVQKRYTKPPD